MLLDTIHGIIDRRILLNYHVEPGVLQGVLPPGFRPKVFQDKGIGGVCLIRFRELRPRKIPSWLGRGQRTQHIISRSSGTKTMEQKKESSFRAETAISNKGSFVADELSVTIRRADGSEEAHIKGRVAQALPDSSLFDDVQQAAAFFSLGATGYSATYERGHYHGMELRSLDWSINPMEVEDAHTSFFSDRTHFPEGTVELDCALVMRGIDHEWHS